MIWSDLAVTTLMEFQGVVIWRARLTSRQLPKDEMHIFQSTGLVGGWFPISNTQFVWTVAAPVSRLEEVGLEAKTWSTAAQHSPGHASPSAGQNEQQDTGHGSVQGVNANLSASQVASAIMLALF